MDATTAIWRWQQEFALVDANTQVQRMEAFRLRHSVFVEEHGWYPARGDTEIDGHDFQSSHGLLYHKPAHRLIGTVRLISTDTNNPAAQLPAEQLLSNSPAVASGHIRQQTAEVSRFTLVPAFRSSDSLLHPMLGLITWQFLAGARLGITYLYAVMEPRLVRGLRRFGIHFVTLSNDIECHGTCRVYGQAIDKLIDGIEAEQPAVWMFMMMQGLTRYW